MNIPSKLPQRPFFGSGPCAKHPQWTIEGFNHFLQSQSHRSTKALSLMEDIIQSLRTLLHIPEDYAVAFTPGSATGAIETALWNLLGIHKVNVLVWDIFSLLWGYNLAEQLRCSHTLWRDPHAFLAYASEKTNEDFLCTYTGTTAGISFSEHNFLPHTKGLVIVDAAAAIMTTSIPWHQCDVVTFSWQKGLAGEAHSGILVMSPKAMERLNTYKPTWPIPRLYRLHHHHTGDLLGGFFDGGKVINTPSMLLMQEAHHILQLWQKDGGLLPALRRCERNARILYDFCNAKSWLSCDVDPLLRAQGPVCLTLPHIQHLSTSEQWKFLKTMENFLYEHKAAYDILNHADAAPCLRIWCGPAIQEEDLMCLCSWLQAAYTYAADSHPSFIKT